MPFIVDKAHANDTAAVVLMLDLGFDALVPGPDDFEAIRWAAFHGNPEMTRRLLQHDPPINVPDRSTVARARQLPLRRPPRLELRQRSKRFPGDGAAVDRSGGTHPPEYLPTEWTIWMRCFARNSKAVALRSKRRKRVRGWTRLVSSRPSESGEHFFDGRKLYARAAAGLTGCTPAHQDAPIRVGNGPRLA